MDCFSQNDSARVLIFPLRSKAVYIDGHVQRMLKYNKIHPDTMKSILARIAARRFKTNFSHLIQADLTVFIPSDFFNDSTGIDYRWSSTGLARIAAFKRFKRFKKAMLNNTENKYYGQNLDESQLAILKNLTKQEGAHNLVFINIFETIALRPFVRKTFLRTHFEIYDRNMKLLYSGYVNKHLKIIRRMYRDIFEYTVRNSIDELCVQVNAVLKSSSVK